MGWTRGATRVLSILALSGGAGSQEPAVRITEVLAAGSSALTDEDG